MTKTCHKTHHPDHTKELARLNRIAGQVEGIKEMINERRYCIDILTQLKAIRSALKSVEAEVFRTHLGSCLVEASKDEATLQDKLDEINDLYRKFEN